MSSHQNSSTVPDVDPSPTTTGEVALMILITLLSLFFVTIVLYIRAKYSRAATTIDEHLPLTRPRPLVFAPDSRTARAPRRHRRLPLDPSILKALPVSVFPSEDFMLKGVAGVEYSCAVCLSEFADGEEVRVLPRCRHGFHVECIDMWFHSNSTCPLCRLPVALASSVQPTVGSPSPPCAEVVGSKTCVVNIDQGSSSSGPSPSPSSSLACSTLRRVLSRGSDMLVGTCNGSRGSDIEEGVLGVPIPNSSV